MATCHDIYGLTRLIRRAGAGFHLNMDFGSQLSDICDGALLRTIGSEWMDGIQSLSISRYSRDEPLGPFMESLENLLRDSNLKSLKSISCKGVFSSTVIERLFPQMKNTAVELTTLEIQERLDTYHHRIHSSFWLPFPLGRITSLYLACTPINGTFVPWGELTSLKLLDFKKSNTIHSTESTLGLSKIDAPHLSSLRASGEFKREGFFSHKTLENLSRLALHCYCIRRIDEAMFPPSFPSLKLLDFYLTGSIAFINAPKLVELAICDYRFLNKDSRLLNAPITPRILRIRCDSKEYEYPRLSKYFKWKFSNAHVWSRLEEIHITAFGVDELQPAFIQLLKGHREAIMPCFPKLVCLTVRYYPCREGEKMYRVNQLLYIMSARIKAGLPRFTTLEVGWMAVGCRPEVRWGEEEWFVTEWRDCLQENNDEEWEEGEDEEDEEEESDA
ncbi:hypothetical protein M408DRAFT_24896 [Serendipita vermifera MAFF 305830]|uniref:F-box domain-containing protein n=1 Tax=Serendipita vermifera MAFF 305830 TaxID=933852 RepID=A0A0C3B6U0_SERVB|nr:hypothetical protein M408DRAFT_24896 [Serendipita vermifera MAFF 305830]